MITTPLKHISKTVDFSIRARQCCEMDNVIDARGLICPLPVLKLAKILRDSPKGTIITLWADDPVAVIDIPHYCTQSGHVLISQSEQDDHQVYVVERT